MSGLVNTNGQDELKLRRQLPVYFIMGSNNCLKDPVEVLEEAIAGGITIFQFREKGKGALVGEQKRGLARRLRDLCARYEVPFIVNDDVDLALEVDADGVHVGQDDEEAAAVRKRIGSRILGVSAHDEKEAASAIRQGADYLGVGPMFATRTKEDAKEAVGAQAIRRLRDLGIRIPVVGIGGITPENAASVIEAGADGVSVITAISRAPDVKAAAEALRRAVLHG